MSFNKLLAGLKEQRTQSREAAQASYLELVKAAAMDNPPDAASATRILADAKQTPEQLADDVAALLERRRLRELVAGRDDARSRRFQLDKQIEAEKRSFRQLETEHHERLAALAADRRTVDDELQRIGQAQSKLARVVGETAEEQRLKSERAEHTAVLMVRGVPVNNDEERRELAEERANAQRRLQEIDQRLKEIATEKALAPEQLAPLLDAWLPELE